MKHYTEANIQLYEKAMQLQMFLISELGPTKLLFKVGDGDDAQKVKISLTDTLKCSCNPGSNSRCAHGVFAMVKVFKLPSDDPLVFQEKFTDAQLNMILEGRFKKKNNEHKKHDFLKRKTLEETTSKKEPSKKPKLRKEVDTSETCPICYDELGETEPLSPCKCCSNGFHIKCLLTWSKHQMKVEPHRPIKCPMCRAAFDDSPSETVRSLEYDMQKFMKIEFVHPGTSCAGCNKKELIGPIYASVWHANKMLCKTCYELRNGSRKGVFIYKVKSKDPWQAVNGNIDNISQYLAAALPSLGQSETDQLQIVGFDASNVNCQNCKEKSNTSAGIKKLPCDHKVCQKCLYRYWRPVDEEFCCPLDGLPVFPLFIKSKNKQFLCENQDNLKRKPPGRNLTLVQNNLHAYRGNQEIAEKDQILLAIEKSVQSKKDNRRFSAGKRLIPKPMLTLDSAIAVTPIGLNNGVNIEAPGRNLRRPIQTSTRILPPRPNPYSAGLSFEPVLTVTRAIDPIVARHSQLPSIANRRSRQG